MATIFRKDLEPFHELARTFALRELAPRVRETDRFPFCPSPSDVLDKARDAGLLGIVISEDMGGSGGGIGALCVILEEISRVDASFGTVLFTTASAQLTASRLAGKDTAARLFRPRADTRDVLAAFPVYLDPLHPSTALPVSTFANGVHTLRGKLDLLSLGAVARRAVVPAGDPSGLTFHVLDLDQQGISLGDTVFTLGMHSCPCVDVNIEDAKAEPLAGAKPGRTAVEDLYAELILASGAISSGIMKGAYETALSYARQRRQGGKEIVRWSEVAKMLADMLVDVHAAELCVHHACRVLEEAPDDAASREHARAAGIHVHAMACRLVADGIQVLGGYGYMKDYGQEKRYRDAHQAACLAGSGPMAELDMLRRAAGIS